MSLANPASAPGPNSRFESRTGFSTRDLVLGVAAVMVAAHVLLRAWMLWPSWFYEDDYIMLGEADAQGFSASYLTEPYGGRFMPLGRLLVWWVADSGSLNWHAAAFVVIALVVLADLACMWMLFELFGPRWGVLLPLSAYLTSAMIVPATMWWAAALDQMPLQVALFSATAAWVRYLRTGRARWWLITVAALAFGLLAFVKTLLVVVVLAWVTLSHFTTGNPWRRVLSVLRDHTAGAVVLIVGSASYLVWYLTSVPSLVTAGNDGESVAADLAGTMLGRTLPVGLLGGPWRWGTENPPVALADPPAAAVVVAWIVLVVGTVALALLRRRTGRVWCLLTLYAVMAYLLLLTTRAPAFGPIAGLEYRYLTDVGSVAALCLGLATMRLRGASEPTERRQDPALRVPTAVLRPAPAVTAVVLVASGLASSLGYARIWHDHHPSRDYFVQVRSEFGRTGGLDLADANVPEDVASGLMTPWNSLSNLLPQAGLEARFPMISTELAVISPAGRIKQAFVDPVILGERGPQPDCGYRLDINQRRATVTLQREVPPGIYWMRIGYLSSGAATILLDAGDVSGAAQVSRGLGSIFVNVTQGAEEVQLTMTGDAAVCVADVEAGPLVEGRPW